MNVHSLRPAVTEQLRESSGELFRSLIKQAGFEELHMALGNLSAGSLSDPKPSFRDCELGHRTLMDAQVAISRSLGRPVDRDELKTMIEEVLQDELNAWRIELVASPTRGHMYVLRMCPIPVT